MRRSVFPRLLSCLAIIGFLAACAAGPAAESHDLDKPFTTRNDILMPRGTLYIGEKMPCDQKAVDIVRYRYDRKFDVCNKQGKWEPLTAARKDRLSRGGIYLGDKVPCIRERINTIRYLPARDELQICSSAGAWRRVIIEAPQ